MAHVHPCFWHSCLTTSEILSIRKSMWEKVSSRKHKPIQIFPFGSRADEVMLHGTVEYTFKDGRTGGVPWAARGHVVKAAEGTYRMDYYQVYLDSAAQGPK